MQYKILPKINCPEDLRALSEEDIPTLSSEIRDFLVEKVEKRGGHLASNLGVVELTVALHRVFDSPNDKIIFDVGHQSYVHKIITGRTGDFDKLRVPGGLSGFTSRRESEHDPFGAGHSSTALSAALGFAESEKLKGTDNYTVAIIGDGAYTGGMVHEAMNNCKPDLRLIIVLNENGMSISRVRGAFASYLSRVRISKGYVDWKKHTKNLLDKIPVIGISLHKILTLFKNTIKKILYRENYFEELGLYYLGPIDGNDYKKVERALLEAKSVNGCAIVHLKTVKGKGHTEAEESPEIFHSLSKSTGEDYHSVFADELCSLAQRSEKTVAVTAAMGQGTGLSRFETEFPDRFFDVGIAEDHALTFSCGLAANGYSPFCAIYSTFLQRGYDSILHDLALQKLPVKIFIDRAGLSLGDGATHHGIFDVSFLSHIPGIEILSPASFGSLRGAVRYANDRSSPIAVRYPNCNESREVVDRFFCDDDFDSFRVRYDFDIDNPPECIFVTYGNIAQKVLEAEDMLRIEGKTAGTVLIERLKPMTDAVKIISGLIARGCKIVFVEEGIKNGGAGVLMLEALVNSGVSVTRESYRIAAIDDNFASPRDICDLYDFLGLSPTKLKGLFL